MKRNNNGGGYQAFICTAFVIAILLCILVLLYPN